MRAIKSTAVIAGALLLAGCGSGTAATTTVTEAVTVTVTATPSPSTSSSGVTSLPSTSASSASSTPTSANAGGQPLGTTQTLGTAGHVTVFAIDRNVPPAPGDDANEARTAIDAQLCLDGPDAPQAQISSIPWYLTDASNGRYSPASSTWQSDPQPQYPVGAVVNPGECVRGWLMMNAPASSDPRTVRYESTDEPSVLIWSL